MKPLTKKPQGNEDNVLTAIAEMSKKLDQAMSDQKSFRSSMEARMDNLKDELSKKISAESKPRREEFQLSK